MSQESQISSYDVVYFHEIIVFIQTHSTDVAVCDDLKISKHLEGFEAVINNLIALTKLYKYVGFGDFVKIRDQNVIVDTLKLLDTVFQVYYPCPNFSEIVNKIRYVYRSDIILPEDHNLVVDAIKSARNCIAEVVPETELIALDTLIAMLNYVKYGEPVLSFHYNTKIDALKQLLKFIFKYLLIIEEKTIHILSEYSLTTALLNVLTRLTTEVFVTIESLTYFVNLSALCESTTASLDVTNYIISQYELTLYSLYILPEVITIFTATTDATDLIATVAALLYTTLYTIDSLATVQTLHDFPQVVEGLASTSSLYDFPEVLDCLSEVTTFYDFPDYISYDLNTYLDFSYTLREVSKLVYISSLSSVWIEPLLSFVSETYTYHHETIHTLDKLTPIFVESDLPVTLAGFGILSLEFDFPQYLDSEQNIIQLLDHTIESHDLAVQTELEIISMIESYDSLAVSQLFAEKTLESYDIDLIYSLIFDRTLESYDFDAQTQLIFEPYKQSCDLEIYGSEAVVERTVESYDRMLMISTLLYKTTTSTDRTPIIQTGYEFEYIFWLRGFKYRRQITITNNAQGVYDYQVLIILTPQNFNYSKVKPDGSDIRFTKYNGVTKLPYWIELWNPQGVSWIWVKIDYLPSGGTTIFMYYGNPEAESEEAPERVFQFFDHFDSDTIDMKWRLKYGQGADMNRVIKL